MTLPTTETTADERRQGSDRRARPTPLVSRYLFRGRRRAARRAGEGERVYFDRYGWRPWLLALSVLALSTADLLLTLRYIDLGGEEANPVMAWTLERGRPLFVASKLIVTAFGVLFLVLHDRFRLARRCLETFVALYCLLIVYHIWLIRQGAPL